MHKLTNHNTVKWSHVHGGISLGVLGLCLSFGVQYTKMMFLKSIGFQKSRFDVDCYRGLSRVCGSKTVKTSKISTDGTECVPKQSSKQIMKVVFDSVARQLMMARIYPKYNSENISGLSHKPVWRTRLKLVWPEEIYCEGTGITKMAAERAAASEALSKLKELGVLGDNNVPIININTPVTTNNSDHRHPTMLLYQIYQNVCNAFNSYEFIPSYATVKKKDTSLPLWETTLILTWPTEETFSATACRKGDAEKEASALAIKHLRKIGAVDKQLNPIIHTAKEIQEFRNEQLSPQLLTLPDDILLLVNAFVKDINNLNLNNSCKSNIAFPLLVRDDSYEHWSDEDPAGVPADFQFDSIFTERSQEGENNNSGSIDNKILENFESGIGSGVILDAFIGQPYKIPGSRLLESRNLELYRKAPNTNSWKAGSFNETAEAPPLTIADRRREILDTVAANSVVIIVGDTGCGKTTQVPQFLLDEYAGNMAGVECNVVVTQPRRISAFAVARRVAEERGEQLGDREGTVGYRIRLEGKVPRRPGRVLFCPTGVLLRRLRSNPDLIGVSHVIVDEVHERDTLIDLLLTLLRDLVARRGDFRVLLMSATMNHERLSRYFGGCPVLTCPGFLHPVTEYHMPDIRRLFRLTADNISTTERNGNVITGHRCDVEEVAKLVAAIDHDKPKEGAILCFLPGWKEIAAIRQMLLKLLPKNDGKWVLPLHSKLVQSEQSKIFEHPPPGIRKIVLATSIAESSITVNDVVYVIDSGLQREMRYDPQRGVAYLDTDLVTKANAKQRLGRAGRTQPGECFRLYSVEVTAQMRDFPVPAMQVAPLQSTVLDTKAYFPEARAIDVLSRTPDPPDPFLVSKAVQELRDTGIVDDYEKLTLLGRAVLHFGLHPRLAKAIVYSSLFGCVDPIITMAAIMSNNKQIFLRNGDLKNSTKQMKKTFASEVNSDHLAYINIFNECQQMHPSDVNRFCEENDLDAVALSYASGLRKQLALHLCETKLASSIESCFDVNDRSNRNSKDILIVKTVLALSMSPNMLHLRRGSIQKRRIKKNSNYFINQNGVNVHIRGDSINANDSTADSPWMVYFHSLHSTDRKVEIVSETSSVPLLSLILFSGSDLTIHKFDHQPSENKTAEKVILAIDGSDIFRFCCSKMVAETLRSFRSSTSLLLNWLLANPPANRQRRNSKIFVGSDFYPDTLRSDSHSEATGLECDDHIRELQERMFQILTMLLQYRNTK